jgi:hypothetical protein
LIGKLALIYISLGKFQAFSQIKGEQGPNLVNTNSSKRSRWRVVVEMVAVIMVVVVVVVIVVTTTATN